MWAQHPDIARRWASEFGSFEHPKSVGKSPESTSGVSPNPKVNKLPRRTAATDFKPLSPGSKARHTYKTPAKEQDSMAEGHGIKFQPGSRGHHLDKFKKKG